MFGEYFVSAKAYRTTDILNPFFWKVAKFLLEVGCVHVNAYGMPKQKAGVIIETFEGKEVDWGVITGPTLREGLHAYQSGKKLRPIIQQYLTVLIPPRGLPAPTPSQPTPTPRTAKRRVAELAATKWEEEPRPSQTIPHTTQEERSTNRAETTNEQADEPRQDSPRPKRRRLDQKDGRGLVKDTPVVTDKPTKANTTVTEDNFLV